MAQARPEDIEYRYRLKWGTVFQYTTEQHRTSDVLVDNYFHNIAQRYLTPGDEIHIAVRDVKAGSWTKSVFEVVSMDKTTTVVEQLEDWRVGGVHKKAAVTKKAA